VLLKGKVGAHGELQGNFWVNASAAHPWMARHAINAAAAEDVSLRKVGLPWAVPVRRID
jgi:hypothetical protein